MDSNLLERAKVYPHFKECSVQTFNEQNKEDKTFSRIMEMNNESLQRCETLQKNQPY